MTDEAGTLKDAPGRPGRSAPQQPDVADELREAADEAKATGDAVRGEASGLASTIRQGVSSQVEQQKNGIADRLSTVAERAQRSAADLRRDEPWLGELLGRGASELEGLASELRSNEIGDLMGSVEAFARRQPALFMGATVALGYALTRFVGASAADADRYPTSPSRGYGHSGADVGADRGGI